MFDSVKEIILKEKLDEDKLLALKLLFPNTKITIETKENLIESNKLSQKLLCKSLGVPVFAPNKCFKCGTEIYDSNDKEYFKTTHITSCMKCNKSFID